MIVALSVRLQSNKQTRIFCHWWERSSTQKATFHTRRRRPHSYFSLVLLIDHHFVRFQPLSSSNISLFTSYTYSIQSARPWNVKTEGDMADGANKEGVFENCSGGQSRR
jgi:hypothetical protein